jgi:vacuolar-type H+-ATPase subunit D/Vma8
VYNHTTRAQKNTQTQAKKLKTKQSYEPTKKRSAALVVVEEVSVRSAVWRIGGVKNRKFNVNNNNNNNNNNSSNNGTSVPRFYKDKQIDMHYTQYILGTVPAPHICDITVSREPNS